MGKAVNFNRCFSVVRFISCGFIVLFLCQTSIGEAGVIHLKREPIETDSAANRSAMVGLMHGKSISGLFLVQFRAPLATEQRAQLKQAGVTLIQYVPDDSYLARFKQVSPDTLRKLHAVYWVGTFRTEDKVSPRLTAELAGNQKMKTLAVNILISPDASPAEMGRLRGLLAKVQHESRLRQGTILRADIVPANLQVMAQSDAALWIEPAPKRKLYDEEASKLVGGDDGAAGTPTITQQQGFDGSGVTVCVADTGLDTGDTNMMHPDLSGRVTGLTFYGTNILDASDGYGHGTHCAGIVAGNAATGETNADSGALYGLGIASGASLFIERIFDDAAGEASPFPSDETLTHDAVRHGARIGSNSWGNDTQGDYDLDCMQFDALVRDADADTSGDQSYILEFSAGNAGPASQTVGSPACAKNVIATGASENVPNTLAATYGLYADGPDTMADFSSRGPCADGRIKPDLVAPGTWIASAASSVALDLANTTWTVIDDYYVYEGGTSMSGPYAAGSAAVFVQFYQSTHTNAVPSPALVKAALINSANELDQANGGPGSVPNNDEGWGRITLTNIITTNSTSSPRYYEYLDQTVRLTNSQVYEQHVFVQGADQPLKVTMAYTDVPGFPGAIPALVNDLDLEVVGPDGTLYRGNQFGAGESVPNASTPDKLNNVEGVYLAQPIPGDYLVRVRASHVVQDALTNTPAEDQDFALVCSGDLVRPGTGFILLDRSSYTAPGTMKISVFDAARTGMGSVNVTVTNLTAHAFVTQTLTAAGNYGAFTGAVATVAGSAGAGQIQIANGDQLEADYFDAHSIKRMATATADLVLPSINSVSSGTDMGALTITWQTLEPTTSIVRYGTNSSNLNLGVTNLALETSHLVKLTRLAAGQTYYYLIVSSDAAGNTTTDNHGGGFYTFTGVATPTVLLVDAYDGVAVAANGGTPIPDSAYTNILASAGVNYGFWKVIDRGGPQLADLKPYPIVIWRLTDDVINYGFDPDTYEPDPTATNNTLNAQQQYMIQSYLNGGGSFFLASMEILSRLGNSTFRRNVLHVGGFTQNTSLFGICPDCDEDHGVPAFFGAPDAFAEDLFVTNDYTHYPSLDLGDGDVYGPDFSDTYSPSSDATPITYESASGRPCGMSYPKPGVDSPGRVVFLSFPLDAVPTGGVAPNNAMTLLQNAIQFLAPGANGIGLVSLDSPEYTTNEFVTVEVGDSDLAGAGPAQVSFVASSRTNEVLVQLQETAHPGLFRGSLALVGAAPDTNQLQVDNGDIITATYFDASRNSNVTAVAIIDTVPPVITNVAAATDFYNARVTWQTSKLTDSAVQYGYLNQPPIITVYDADLVTNHSVTISGLLANRVYHYQVVSRDRASNTAVDDNNGNYYTFTTLKGLTPPWFDDFEAGAGGWTAVPDPTYGSDINWTFGTPINGLATSAHSGTNAWGSDLNGEQDFFQANSFLYSPPIDLSGLTSATLTFSNVYDFSRTYMALGYTFYEEDGGVFISLNNSPPSFLMPLAVEYTNQVANTWQKETVDLTPWVGQTVQIVFGYQANTFGDTIYGWTIDDVGITGTMAGGEVSITKNLAQGTWSLSSLSTIGLVPVQSGTDQSKTISNLPAADYVVQFGGVPFYDTPPPQTNTLVVDGTLNFTGDYTFPDVNNNGISDYYELYYFGNVSTNRTQFTDTDGDGMTDYAESITGTDPTNAASRFYFTGETVQSNKLIQLQWMVGSNRLCQVESSTNLTSWTPLSAWLQSSNSTTMNCTVTNSGAKRFYRVQVQP